MVERESIKSMKRKNMQRRNKMRNQEKIALRKCLNELF